MRKLFILAALLVGLSGVAFAVEPGDVGELKGVKGRDQGEQVRTYKLVRYSNNDEDGTSLTSNDVVVYDTVSDDGVSVRRTTTSADGAIAGIVTATIQTSDATSTLNAQDDAGRRNWGYILVHGRSTAKTTAGAATSFAAGDRFVTSADAGAIGTCQTMASGTAAIGNNVNSATACHSATGGFVLDAGAAGDTSIDVFVKLE